MRGKKRELLKLELNLKSVEMSQMADGTTAQEENNYTNIGD